MCRILLVEDSPELAENLKEILESQGNVVTVAASAEAAQNLLANEDFDGMLTDLRLPGRSGLELIQAVRAANYWLPIVLMTAFVADAEREQAERDGALDVLAKPVDLSRLFALVQEFQRPQRGALVVEDNLSQAANFAEILRGEGFEPIVAHNLREALALRHLPSIAVVDFALPDGDGVEAATVLRARNPQLRVFVVTGHPAAANERLAAARAPFITFTKPVSIPDLLQALHADAG